MAGLSDFASAALLNWALGVSPMPDSAATIVGSRFLALYTTAPNDSGAGGVEVSAGTYARIQFAGSITVNGATLTSSPTLHVASVPAWLAALGTIANPGFGVNVYDLTTSALIGTVSTCTGGGTTITLQANAASAVGATDVLQFSAFPTAIASSGAEPATVPGYSTNSSAINYATSGASAWGTTVAFGVYDLLSGGNFFGFDWLGTFKWIPFTCTSASPGVLTSDTVADAPPNGTSCVVTAKFGGILPPTGGSWANILTSAGLSGATFNLGVNTTGIGGGQFRQVATQVVPTNNVVTFGAANLTLTAA